MKFSTLLALCPLALGAVEVPLEFTINPATSTATATYRIGTIPTSLTTVYTAPLNYSGTLLATAEMDPDSGAIDAFRFTGGNIVTPDLSTLLDVYVGTVLYKVQFATSGIRRVPTSSGTDPMTGGKPQGSLHTTDFSAGSMTTSNYPPDYPSVPVVSYTLNPAEQATYLIGPNIINPTTLTTTELFSGPLRRSVVANLYSPINLPVRPGFTQVPVAGFGGSQSFTHDYKESGSLYAVANASVPTAFGQWAIGQGLTLATGQEVNGAGLPYALLFAFDLPADAASLPLTMSRQPTVTLTLPASGLGFTVRVEYAALPGGTFAPLPAAHFLSGTASLDAGKTAPAVLSFPAGTRGFMRFAVTM